MAHKPIYRPLSLTSHPPYWNCRHRREAPSKYHIGIRALQGPTSGGNWQCSFTFTSLTEGGGKDIGVWESFFFLMNVMISWSRSFSVSAPWHENWAPLPKKFPTHYSSLSLSIEIQSSSMIEKKSQKFPQRMKRKRKKSGEKEEVCRYLFDSFAAGNAELPMTRVF